MKRIPAKKNSWLLWVFLAFAFYCDRVQQQVIGFYAFLTQQKQPSVYFPCVGQIHRWMATKNIMTFPHENWRKYVESRKKFFLYE